MELLVHKLINLVFWFVIIGILVKYRKFVEVLYFVLKNKKMYYNP